MIEDRDTFFLQPPTPTKRCFRPFQFRLSTILVLMVLLGGFFVWLRDYVHNRPIDWIPYSAEALIRERSEGRAVLLLVDAQWNLTAAWTRTHAVETRKVRSFVRNARIVAMDADWTDGSPKVDQLLASLDERSIPLIAIFPADESADPIKLRDLITEEQVLAALQEVSGERP